MAKKHKHEEHVNHERWLVSYADFITLLFAFFVILYALSEVDKNKLKKFSQSVQFAFAHVGSGGTMTMGKNPKTFSPKIIGQTWPMGRRDSDPGPFEGLRSIVEFLENSIVKYFVERERTKVEVIDEDKGIILKIPAERLFARGSGSLQNDRVNFLLDFGRVVAKNNVSFHVHLDLKIPESKDRVAEHDLGNRRLSALVRAISGETRESRASYMTSSEIIVAEVSPSDGENSRQIFEFRILPS
ncbi:MAG: hypothetical protein JNL94_06500 [Planctomycetes bacterium]|nr:hypothetical protein [Planctomycetota bacterium]